MPTVAEILRNEREARSLSIQQVADMTKLRSDHVRALEEGRYEAFSAPVYIRGFVRSYASILRLNIDSVMSTLDQELAQTEEFREAPNLVQPSKGVLDFIMFQFSKVNWRVVWPILAIALIAFLGIWGIRAWQRYKTKDPLSTLGPGIYQAPVSAPNTLPLPPVTNR